MLAAVKLPMAEEFRFDLLQPTQSKKKKKSKIGLGWRPPSEA